MSQLKELNQDWDDLAHLDPMWAICSDPEKQYGKWDPGDFFAMGKQEIHQVLDLVGSLGIKINPGTALDFGCGIGRLTQALAQTFALCYGVDISPRMIELANQFNQFGDKCRYIVNNSDHLQIFEDNSFHFIYTSIVLQHMPPDLMEKYLREFVRILKVDGVMVFQLPVRRDIQDSYSTRLKSLPRYHPARIWNKARWLMVGDLSIRFNRLSRLGFSKTWLYHNLKLRPRIVMNYLDESVVCALVTNHNAKVVHIARDNQQAGSEMISAQFVVTKLS